MLKILSSLLSGGSERAKRAIWSVDSGAGVVPILVDIYLATLLMELEEILVDGSLA